jgi:mono/diheme cytochrome c family protein
MSLIVKNGFRSHMGGGSAVGGNNWRLASASVIPNPQRRFSFMKRSLMLLAAFALASSMAWAQDGAALYKSKCAACHGAMGEGKVGPSLQKTSLTQEQITDLLTKGAEGKKAPHSKAVSGLTADQAAAVATYVGTLKK